ncbi:PKD domain-containing protein, partial [candidate division KSB1 bacterium]|nr:PKD domain-containing protein [candidate division KSB1 bacterium]
LVQFTGSNSADSDGNIAAFKWTFGDGDSATIANPSHTYNDAGNYLARLIVTDNLGARDTAEVNVTVTALAATTIIRVNAGGGQYTATNGNFFSADQSYAPGSWGYTALGYAKTTTTGIANTTESPLYQDLHEKAELSYRFDVPNGAYDLILHFVEIADNEANRRLIDATAEGNIVVNDLDVWVAAGGKYVALRRSITGVVVSDGQLNLDFVRSISSVKRPPAIAAIEVGTAGSLSLAKEHESSFANVLVPEAYALEQNYPNPFNPTTVITFSLPQAGEVRLAFYNALGQPARRPIVRYFTAGRYKITIDASEWAAGVYFYEMKVNNYRALKKMILAK